MQLGFRLTSFKMIAILLEYLQYLNCNLISVYVRFLLNVDLKQLVNGTFTTLVPFLILIV